MSVERSLPRSSTQAIVRVFTLGRFALEVNGRPLRFAGKLPRKPLVLVLEDWHWADEASDGALAYLQGLISAAPLLLIVTTRPEGAPGWPPLSYHSQLALQPLPGAESARLAAAALEAQEVPGELAQLLHARCRGNPFFVEEVCRTLLEEGSVRIEEGRAVLTRPAEALRLPDMVQAVVRSRIDRLDETCRDVLRLAHRL
jgi:predicted ATPase